MISPWFWEFPRVLKKVVIGVITLRERLERFCLTWLGALGCSHHTHPDICEGLFLGMDATKSMKTGRFFSIHSIVHQCASLQLLFLVVQWRFFVVHCKELLEWLRQLGPQLSHGGESPWSAVGGYLFEHKRFSCCYNKGSSSKPNKTLRYFKAFKYSFASLLA